MSTRVDNRLRVMLGGFVLLLAMQWCMPAALFGAGSQSMPYSKGSGLPAAESCDGKIEVEEDASAVVTHAMSPAEVPSRQADAFPQELNADRECQPALRGCGLQPSAP